MRKATNPKDVAATNKVPFDRLPMAVVAETAVALHEGAQKYGYHNWREEGVQSGVYVNAALRHLLDWQEGQDIDPGSGLNHITKAIAGLMILRDGMIQGNYVDTRPIGTSGFIEALNDKVEEINKRYPDMAKPFLAEGRQPRPYAGKLAPPKIIKDQIKYLEGKISDEMSKSEPDSQFIKDAELKINRYQAAL